MIGFEAIVVRPGQIRPGDVIEDPATSRTFEVDRISPLMIQYRTSMVPVYWIKGVDTQSTRTPHTVQTVCLPFASWYVLSRRTEQSLS